MVRTKKAACGVKPKRKNKHVSVVRHRTHTAGPQEHVLRVLLHGRVDHARGLLRRRGVNELGPGGCAYLISAARSASPRMLQMLIDEGANLEARDDSGDTALSKYRGRALGVRVLVQNGADVSAVRDGEQFFNDDRTYGVLGTAGAARGIRVPFVPKERPFYHYMRSSAYAFLGGRPPKLEARQVRRIRKTVDTPNTGRAHSLRALMAGFRRDLYDL